VKRSGGLSKRAGLAPRFLKMKKLPRYLQERRKEILKAAKMLEKIPTFKTYDTVCLRGSLSTRELKKEKDIITATQQKKNYILRWLANVCDCSMDTPKPRFLKGIEMQREKYFKDDKKVLEAFLVAEKFL